MDTYEELRVKLLVHADIIDVLELLNITLDDLIERFDDRVMMNRDDIEEFLEATVR